ncbi:hypothetical protein SFC65_20250 [Priestia filamentosa]|uniref:hypothetical protein n=1 Tax=Priestia filamentosa TaxID=1402861 RepID=UPI003981B7C4
MLKLLQKGIQELSIRADNDFKYEEDEQLDRYSIVKIEEDYYIVDLYGQLHRGNPKNKIELAERYIHFKTSLKTFLRDLKKKQRCTQDIYKVGLPYKIASDLAGASWERILEIIIDVSEQEKVDLHIYKIK